MRGIPFKTKRVWWICNGEESSSWDQHAHQRTQLFFICTHGACRILCKDGKKDKLFTLSESGSALHVPVMIWTDVVCGPDAVVLCFTNGVYEDRDRINDYELYQEQAKHG